MCLPERSAACWLPGSGGKRHDYSSVCHYCRHGPGYLSDADPWVSVAAKPSSQPARQKCDGKRTRLRDGVGNFALLRLIKPGGYCCHAYHCRLRHPVIHAANADNFNRVTGYPAGRYSLNFPRNVAVSGHVTGIPHPCIHSSVRFRLKQRASLRLFKYRIMLDSFRFPGGFQI